jgi:putative peptide zinc metalloprotease protein
MTRATRLLLAVAVAGGILVNAPATAHAGGDTSAVAINTKDGSSIFRLAFAVRRTMDEVIDESNAAIAFASCEDCRTTAVSIQLVLVMSDPDVVSPTNIAIAINQECIACDTLASAYQYVLTTDGPVHFDAEGNQELAAIRRSLRDLVKRSEDLDSTQIQTEVDALVEHLYEVVDGHLVAAGPDDEEGLALERRSRRSPGSQASGTPPAGDSPAPEPSQPSPEPSQPSPEPSQPSPQPEPSPSPSSTPGDSSTPTPEQDAR